MDGITKRAGDRRKTMLTSKEILERTGISRATLNNYIARGLLPKPVVSRPDIRGKGPRQIGYFDEATIARIELIQRLKREGMSMEEIKLKLETGGLPGAEPAPGAPATGAAAVIAHPASAREQLTLTIDQIPHPAYMVNYKFEVMWFNDRARHDLPNMFSRLAPRTDERSIFHLLLATEQADLTPNGRQLLRLNLALAKERMEVTAITQPLQGISAARIQLLEDLYRDTEPARSGPIVELPLRLESADGKGENRVAYAAYFREGILVILTAVGSDTNELLRLLSRRDMVIRNLLSRRLPVLTELAVLVADLQDSVKICSELPPDEYFELINEIWSTAGEVFRKYYGTYGKHVGDGMVYYFFPQPDCSYIINALTCAQELKLAIARISKEWQLRKNWTNELYLNTGLNEGQEWLGTFQTATTVEFAVLGDTINHTARLSDFARFGQIWATKNFIGKVPDDERKRVKFGVHRTGADGQRLFVDSTYSRLCNLVDLDSGRYEKLRDIGGLPVTEIVNLAPAAV
jgi:adenylate cyclase